MTELQKLKAEIERLDKAATPGPWLPDVMGDAPYVWAKQTDELVAKTWHDDSTKQVANRDFIAYARTALPQLLAMAERLERQRDEAVRALEVIRATIPTNGRATATLNRIAAMG